MNGACLVLLSLLGGSAAGGDLAWRAGAGAAEITPPLEVGILMSSGRGEWAPFEGVRMPLCARAVVIESGGTRVGLLALDLLGLAGEAVGGMDAFRRRVAAASGGAVSAENILFNCSHTHSGPESIALSGLCETRPFRDWAGVLAQRMGSALRDAAGALRPVSLAAARVAAPGGAVNRRLRTARGITVARNVLPGDVVYGPEGPVDDEVRVLALVGGDGRPLAILVQATAHAIYEMCIKQVSPDYPGEMCRLLESRRTGCRVLFLQGAAGNINPPQVSTGADDARRHAARLAEAVERALGKLKPVAGNELAVGWRTVDLPGRPGKDLAPAEPVAARIAALRLGDAALVFLPGEPFVEIGLAIEKASPFSFTAVCGYSNDYIGYIPTDRAYDSGGYETRAGRWSRVTPGAEGAICRGAAELLAGLR